MSTKLVAIQSKNPLSNDYKINYIKFLGRAMQKFESDDFQENGTQFGKLKFIAHKGNNYKKEQAVYREIPFNNKFEIHLMKEEIQIIGKN